ncbi:MAG: TolC family protein [Rhodospirillaceae bacterium]|nr:TolC family protein [Rhodospirillaceae bacterium]MBT5013665.1 TolC family protein [Rhodospirillaceae bacterium]MBT5308167.1 TolC family protein [Rhodospirillaceae bacterium]MBT6407063.1 TolC family protein [Rhodospirillaceae bacterium]MBT7355101.1 TolC family protein [Rhodospirillaceae bacterium]
MNDTRRIFRRKISGLMLALGTCALLPGTSWAAQLDKELSDFIYNHPLVQAGKSSVQSAGKSVDVANAGYMPTLSSTFKAGPERIDNPTTRAANETGRDWSRSTLTAGMTLTQNLFNGYLTHSSVRSARLNKALAAITLEGTLQNTLFEGTSAYIDVLRQMRLVELARNNEDTIQRQLNLEDERVNRGSGIAVDVLQAKSRLQIAKERRVTFEGALEDAASRYMQVFDHPPNLSAMVDPVPPVEMVPSELIKTIEIAMQENPAISNSAVSVEVSREKRRTIRSEYSPVVDVVGAANYEKNNAGTLGTRRDYSVTLQANWQLFSGLTTGHSMDQASFDYGSSKYNHDQTIDKVIE